MAEARTSPEGEEGLEGRTALITGATRGIGRATARLLREAGARVGLVARTEADLAELARELEGWPLACDVSDPDEAARALSRFRELAGGPPDILVTAAGTFSLGPARDLRADELDRHLAVNLRGAIHVVTSTLPGMLERRRGTIVQVGSVAGRKALPGNAAYSASKFGLRGYHEVLLEEIRGTGVRATLLEPAATDTSLWDAVEPDRDPHLPDRSEMLGPEDVARGILWVATRPPGVQVPYLPMERSA